MHYHLLVSYLKLNNFAKKLCDSFVDYMDMECKQ